jgi:hypothetical protein
LQTRDRFVQQFGNRPVRYAEALAAGFSRASLQAAVDRHLLHRPRRGLLVAALAEGVPDPASSHGDHVRSASAVVQPGAWASHESAAVRHGIAIPYVAELRRVQLITPDGANFTGPGLVLRAAPLPPSDREVVDGLPTTSVARTAIDVARGRPLAAALIPLDSAARLLIARSTSTEGNGLRRAVRDPEMRAYARVELEEALSHCFGWAGTVAARTALNHVDPASESAFESRSRGWFIDAGLGALDPGRPVPCAGRTYWADFCSSEHRVIGEADGWSKYGATPREMRAALERERVRQRDLEDDGWRLVRWTTTDRRPSVAQLMSSALKAARATGGG